MTRTINCVHQVCQGGNKRDVCFRDSSGLGADNWARLGKACWCALFQVSSLDTGGTESWVGSSVLHGWFRKPGMPGAPVIAPAIPRFIFYLSLHLVFFALCHGISLMFHGAVGLASRL